MKDPVSHEYINAFIDGELAADERERALQRLEVDPEFKAMLCETRNLKDLVRGAYADLDTAGQRPAHAAWRGGWQALAASVLMIAGGGLGWLANDHLSPVRGNIPSVTGLPGGYMPVALAERVDTDKVVLHLDAKDEKRFTAILDLAERLLRQNGPNARVEIVVNSYGLNLLRAEDTPTAARISRMADQYGNLSFIACGQSLARFRKEGAPVELLPSARVASSAINEIMARMRHGWVYVKV